MVRVIEAKGPAEAATSPSHGSNLPTKGNAVNRQQATIKHPDATRAPFDYESEWGELEDLALTAKGRIEATCIISEHMGGMPYGDGNGCIVTRYELDTLLFMIEETRSIVVQLDERLQTRPPLTVRTSFSDLDGVTQIESLIRTHRKAAQELREADAEDARNDTGKADYENSERYQLAAEAASQAFEALIGWKVKSAEAHSVRLSYVWCDPDSPWKDAIPGQPGLNLLAQSAAGVAAPSSEVR